MSNEEKISTPNDEPKNPQQTNENSPLIINY